MKSSYVIFVIAKTPFLSRSALYCTTTYPVYYIRKSVSRVNSVTNQIAN